MAALADPVAMIEQGAPHLIHTDTELAEYTRTLMRLTSIDHPSPSEREAIDLLSLLIERYESQHSPLPEADAVEVVRFLLDQHDLKQRDLAAIFGGEPQVSMFLSGQRKLTVGQIQGLSQRFHVPAEVFFKQPPATGAPEPSLAVPRAQPR